jgi:PAS domain S-box-containing protein
MKENSRADIVHNSIIQDLGEGILTFGLDGIINLVNPAAEAILGIPKEDLQGKRYGTVLFRFRENDLFNQAILDAIYDSGAKHENVVPYFDGKRAKHLHVTSSFLRQYGEQIGIIVLISDLTEIAEMELRHMQQINALIESMVKTLSVAIDERSHYTARHTQNMVRMGEAFLDWLKATGNPWKFNDEQRRGLLMSIWLYDVGKIAIPLEIMDKATRLGPLLKAIEDRFSRIALLDRIALLEGHLSQEGYAAGAAERAEILSFVRQINTKGFVTEEDMEKIRTLSTLTYTEEDGTVVPLITAEEAKNLSIRKGTLTQEERQTMQSHATLTRRILNQVSFPPEYSNVPLWASSHHELLNGRGYPEKKTGTEISKEVQLITILDIFEALTAKDRPYKPPIPLEKAWSILGSMGQDGSLNGELLELFRKSCAWQSILR